MHRFARGLLLTAIVAPLAGCAYAPAGGANEASPLRVGDSVSYVLRFEGTSYAEDEVSVAVNETASVSDRFGRPRDAVHVRLRVIDDEGGYDYPIFVATDTREILRSNQIHPVKGGAEVYAVETNNWYGHPVAGGDVAKDLQRCLYVGLVAAPFLLFDGAPAQVAISGIVYEVAERGDEWTLTTAREDALAIRVTHGDGALPSAATLLRADGSELCHLQERARTAGTTPIALARAAPPLAPEAPRAAWQAGVPPAGGVPAEYPLVEAVARAREEPEVARWLDAHPAAYLFYAEFKADRPDEVESVRTAQWILRLAAPGGDALMVAVERHHGAVTLPVENAIVTDRRSVSFVPPRTGLVANVADLPWAYATASAMGLSATTVNWFVAERADLVGTPDEQLWQMQRRGDMLESILLSAINGQRISRVVFPPVEPVIGA